MPYSSYHDYTLNWPTTFRIKLFDPFDCIFVYFRRIEIFLEEFFSGVYYFFVYFSYCSGRSKGLRDSYMDTVDTAITPNAMNGSDI